MSLSIYRRKGIQNFALLTIVGINFLVWALFKAFYFWDFSEFDHEPTSWHISNFFELNSAIVFGTLLLFIFTGKNVEVSLMIGNGIMSFVGVAAFALGLTGTIFVGQTWKECAFGGGSKSDNEVFWCDESPASLYIQFFGGIAFTATGGLLAIVTIFEVYQLFKFRRTIKANVASEEGLDDLDLEGAGTSASAPGRGSRNRKQIF